MLPQVSHRCVKVLGRGICLKSTFLNESALSMLGHCWLTFNHYKLAHFCFLSDLYWARFLLYLVRKDLSLASQDNQFFSLFTNWMIKLLLLRGNIHPNPGPQTHILVCDICFKPIAKHQTSILCNYTKYWEIYNAPKSQQRTTTTDGAAYFTVTSKKQNQLHKQTQHHQITFSKSCKLMQMASTTKQMKYNFHIFHTIRHT